MLILPVLPRPGSPRLEQFELRDGIDDFLINLTGSYGVPVVHAVLDNHHVVYQDACPKLDRAGVEQYWANELLLRPKGLTSVQFCSLCTTRYRSAAA